MWKTSLFLLLIILPFMAPAQRNRETTKVYLFNKNWENCKSGKDAAFMILEDRLDDTVFQIRYYSYTGPLIKVETYADYNKTKPNGFFAYYDETGKVDSCGYTWMGKKDRQWLYFDDSLRIIRLEKLERGKMIEAKDAATLRAEKYDTKGTADQSGNDQAFYNGGQNAWKNYLIKNIAFPKRAMDLGIIGTVMVSFTVSKEGAVSDVWLAKSVEYSVDEESVRLIKAAKGWQPALKDGKPETAFRRQPIAFRTK